MTTTTRDLGKVILDGCSLELQCDEREVGKVLRGIFGRLMGTLSAIDAVMVSPYNNHEKMARLEDLSALIHHTAQDARNLYSASTFFGEATADDPDEGGVQ